MKYSPFHISAGSLRATVIIFFSLIMATMSGCSSTGNFLEPTVPEDINFKLPAETLIKKGMTEYDKGKYFLAIEYFNKVLEYHRFSPQAPLAELKLADCKYYMEKYIEAFMYYEKFEEMHPTNEAIAYVMYQKAMCYYKQIDRIDRDTSGASKAIEIFQKLLKAYPGSPYAEDAQAKIASAKEFLANHEYIVAKFYLRTKKNDQAKIRLKYLVTMYPQTAIATQAKNLLQQLEEN